MKNNAYVAKNGDTGEKRKPYQRNPVIWIYRFLNLQRQNAQTQCFIVVAFLLFFFFFLNYLRLSIEYESIFLIQKIYRF